MCDYCDANSRDYKFKTVPFNFGELGKYEIRFGISRSCGATIEMAEEGRDPIIGCNITLRYCPYCGSRLKEEKMYA